MAVLGFVEIPKGAKVALRPLTENGEWKDLGISVGFSVSKWKQDLEAPPGNPAKVVELFFLNLDSELAARHGVSIDYTHKATTETTEFIIRFDNHPVIITYTVTDEFLSKFHISLANKLADNTETVCAGIDVQKNINVYCTVDYGYDNDYPPQPDNVIDQLRGLFPVLNELTQCPVKTCFREARVSSLIPHLNDKINNGHNWTREEIANWLEEADLKIGVTK